MLRVLAKAAEERHRSRISLLRCSPEGIRCDLFDDGLVAVIMLEGWSDVWFSFYLGRFAPEMLSWFRSDMTRREDLEEFVGGLLST